LRCELNDAPHISFYNLATLYKIWNRPERSLQYLHRAISIKPDFEEAKKLKEELTSAI
ncbi:tetratricopeptide repeat protein, partial [Leptospira interrogans]